jgi:large subunit ribosomal protein L25
MDLAASTRTKVGKGLAALRKEGQLPGEVYGHGAKNVHVAVAAKEFAKTFKEAGMTTVITLVNGKEKLPVMVHDVQHDYLSGDIIHVDFHQIRMDEAITAKVPLEFVGDSKAVREQQAMVMKTMTEIEVEALPDHVPHTLKVDLTLLDELNKSVHVKDIVVPKGVKVLVDMDAVIATATPPVKEEEVAAPTETVDVTAIKTEGEVKKEEREAKKETVEK